MPHDFLAAFTEPDLVYREAPHMQSLVFAPLAEALRIDQIHEAICATSWAEFSYLMPADEIAALLRERNEYCEPGSEDAFRIPGPGQPFEFSELCSAVEDGDYPQWLQKQQELYLPRQLLDIYGRQEDTLLNGEYWFIDINNEKGLVAALSDLGVKVERRDDLYFF